MINELDHIGLVRKEVRKWRWAINAVISVEDLEQEGLMGVVRAKETYDETLGKFTTYATPWIRHYINKYVYKTVRLVRVPKNKSVEAYKADKPYPLTAFSLDYCDLDPYEGSGNNKINPLANGQWEIPENDGIAALATSGDEGSFLESQDRKELVAHLLSTLPEREATVLRLRFMEDMTLFETGRKIGLTKERTRQIQEHALSLISERLLKEEF